MFRGFLIERIDPPLDHGYAFAATPVPPIRPPEGKKRIIGIDLSDVLDVVDHYVGIEPRAYTQTDPKTDAMIDEIDRLFPLDEES